MFDFTKTIIYGIKSWVSGELKKLPRPDWNQNDPTAEDYIKNRTHYTAMATLASASVTTSGDSPTCWDAGDSITLELEEGATYTVTIDGVEYTCVCEDDGYGGRVIGNMSLWNNAYDESDTTPFCYGNYDGQTPWFGTVTAGTYEVVITGEVVHKLDEKYLPDGVSAEAIIAADTLANDAMEAALSALDATDFVVVTLEVDIISFGTPSGYPHSSAYTCDLSADEILKKRFVILKVGDSERVALAINLGDAAFFGVARDGLPQRYDFVSDDMVYASCFLETDYLPIIRKDLADAVRGTELSYLVLKSSTSGSTKQFKITVDDTGALSAEEVAT